MGSEMCIRDRSADERENTLPAFERAIAIGADFVELDVQALSLIHI